MHALAESNMPVLLTPGHQEFIRILEYRRITVGGRQPNNDKTAFGDRDTANFHIFQSVSVNISDRTAHAQGFFHNIVCEFKVLPKRV